MNLTITEWAKVNEMNEASFISEITKTMIGIASISMDESGNDGVYWTFIDETGFEYKLFVTRKKMEEAN